MVPGGWTFVVLALAAYRLTRLVGWDVITRPLRQPLTGRIEGGTARDARDHTRGRRLPHYRPHLDDFIHCPFCVGFWVCVVVYAGWLAAPRPTLVACLPFAMNAVVGLVTKTLDD